MPNDFTGIKHELGIPTGDNRFTPEEVQFEPIFATAIKYHSGKIVIKYPRERKEAADLMTAMAVAGKSSKFDSVLDATTVMLISGQWEPIT